MSRPFAALLAFFIALTLPGRPVNAATGSPLSGLDVIELEIAYSTMMARYYQPISPQRLLGGARTGIVAYLHARGVADPKLPYPPAHVDRWSAEDEIVRLVALSVLHYGSHITARGLIDATVSGELSSVHDPYTLLFYPPAYHQFVNFLDGSKFGGIGIELALEGTPSHVRVADVFPGSPADTAGVEVGDEIATIDGTSAVGLSNDALSDRLRGKVGTVVHLGIVRNGAPLATPLALTRAEIAAPDVRAHMIGTVGYVRLRSFGADSGQQLAAALKKLSTQGARSYVLDLRDNGGGYRDAAVDIASHFIAHGPIATIQERSGKSTVYNTKDIAKLDAPLVVLVNENTASASEIVAGAVKDDHAGTIVGERTFGKGVVQELYPLPDGTAMKITTARYFTPGGHDIDHVGIEPDIVIPQPQDARQGQPGSDPQLDRALAVLRAQPPNSQ